MVATQQTAPSRSDQLSPRERAAAMAAPASLLDKPDGWCECGCGERTNRVASTNTARGIVAGDFRRFIKGHSKRLTTPAYEERDCGYSTPCHVWLRAQDGRGYGATGFGGRVVKAHRAAYEKAHGPLNGRHLDHLCKMTLCVNPDHLEPVSQAENNWRSASAKLTPDHVREIRPLKGVTKARALAERFGVKPEAIRSIWRGTHWQGVA